MPAQPFVYANFVSSLDGRIAVVEAQTGESYVLEDLAGGRDWRLFQELRAPMIRALGARGYARLYLLAGPQMLETVVRDGSLSRLYLTLTHQLIGGELFHTLTAGPRLGRAGRLRCRRFTTMPWRRREPDNGSHHSTYGGSRNETVQWLPCSAPVVNNPRGTRCPHLPVPLSTPSS